jgi:hypothetical protein
MEHFTISFAAQIFILFSISQVIIGLLSFQQRCRHLCHLLSALKCLPREELVFNGLGIYLLHYNGYCPAKIGFHFYRQYGIAATNKPRHLGMGRKRKQH